MAKFESSPTRNLERKVCLYGWHLMKPFTLNHRSKSSQTVPRMSIGGYRSQRMDFTDFIETGAIVLRLETHRLLTEDGLEVVLMGMIDPEKSVANGFCPLMVKCFMTGFPPTWRCTELDLDTDRVNKICRGDLVAREDLLNSWRPSLFTEFQEHGSSHDWCSNGLPPSNSGHAFTPSSLFAEARSESEQGFPVAGAVLQSSNFSGKGCDVYQEMDTLNNTNFTCDIQKETGVVCGSSFAQGDTDLLKDRSRLKEIASFSKYNSSTRQGNLVEPQVHMWQNKDIQGEAGLICHHIFAEQGTDLDGDISRFRAIEPSLDDKSSIRHAEVVGYQLHRGSNKDIKEEATAVCDCSSAKQETDLGGDRIRLLELVSLPKDTSSFKHGELVEDQVSSRHGKDILEEAGIVGGSSARQETHLRGARSPIRAIAAFADDDPRTRHGELAVYQVRSGLDKDNQEEARIVYCPSAPQQAELSGERSRIRDIATFLDDTSFSGHHEQVPCQLQCEHDKDTRDEAGVVCGPSAQQETDLGGDRSRYGGIVLINHTCSTDSEECDEVDLRKNCSCEFEVTERVTTLFPKEVESPSEKADTAFQTREQTAQFIFLTRADSPCHPRADVGRWPSIGTGANVESPYCNPGQSVAHSSHDLKQEIHEVARTRVTGAANNSLVGATDSKSCVLTQNKPPFQTNSPILINSFEPLSSRGSVDFASVALDEGPQHHCGEDLGQANMAEPNGRVCDQFRKRAEARSRARKRSIRSHYPRHYYKAKRRKNLPPKDTATGMSKRPQL